MTQRNYQSMLNQYTMLNKRPSQVSDGGGNVWRMQHTKPQAQYKLNKRNPAMGQIGSPGMVSPYSLLKKKHP